MRPLTPPPVALDPVPPAVQYPTIPNTAFTDDGSGVEDSVHVAARRLRSPDGAEPPATRIQRSDALADRPFTPPRVLPVPEIPEPGLINAAKYSVAFVRARMQRRGAIKTLGSEIKQDTEALDQVLGALGREARNAKVSGRVFSAENSAIDAAEARIGALGKEHGDVEARKADENSKFVDVESERNTKLGEAERAADDAHKELQHLEGQRRGLRDKRKELERRQKTYLKNAEDNDRQAGAAQLGDARQDLRRSAEGHRKEAAALEPERQDADRKLASLERPIGEATARLDAAKAELDAAKRSLTDAREGHTHRLAELDAEQKRKSREIGLAEAEIQRRLVTLGTLVNLNRIEKSVFTELYERIDRIRSAITARTTEIEKLTAEREAYDRGTLVRGISTIGGAILLFIALIVILRAMIS
jgi:chromosome segregation ATPase